MFSPFTPSSVDRAARNAIPDNCALGREESIVEAERRGDVVVLRRTQRIERGELPVRGTLCVLDLWPAIRAAALPS
jgi:hypothetical protein